MSRFFKLSAAVIGGVVIVASAATSYADKPKLLWESVFSTAAADRRDVYFSARYFERDSGWHTLEAWRHGTQLLRRKTDDRLELYASARSDSQPGYDYRLFDHQRHVMFKVDQGHLYRIGVFLDWFGLAHVVERPKQRVSLQRTAARPDEASADCQWVVMVRRQGQVSVRTRVCWSGQWGLPLRIRAQTGPDAWEDRFVLDSVREAAAAELSAAPAAPLGYAVFDADRDIAPGGGD